MKKKATHIAQTLAALAIIAGTAYALYYFGKSFIQLAPETQSNIATLSTLVSVPLITYFTQKYLMRHQARESALQQSRLEAYDVVIALFFTLMDETKRKAPLNTKNLQQQWYKIQKSIIPSASPGFIRAWNLYMRVARGIAGDFHATLKGYAQTQLSMAAMDTLLRALRSDMGHTSRSDKPGELIQLIVNDLTPDDLHEIKEIGKKLDQILR
ncbi:hypothetical protein ABYF32_07255 [Buchananella felis]|uniref:hypothetical protein n=1 Tax=Buchananella felis TaxID=3231492 RepID=UPI00352941C1